MLRTLRALLASSLVLTPAVVVAQETTDGPASENPTSAAPEAPPLPAAPAEPPKAVTSSPPEAPAVTVEPAQPESLLGGWHTEVHGYFRAPMALGISSRPDPNIDPANRPDGPSKLQISYGPNRVMDWSYYSFAYTRLQEQDWAEVTFHAKKKHVDAAVGWMGYWLAAAGSRNPDAAAVPGIASLTLDSDLDLGEIKPNIALQMGAWWPGFGYFEKYDTFTLGRFRQIGAQARLTVPLNPELTVTVVQGLGTGRDGKFDYNTANNSPLYASRVGVDLIYYGNLAIAFKRVLDLGLHFNRSWTRDPWLTKEASPESGKAYADAAQAYLSVIGGEASVIIPVVGRVWLSPSYVRVKNGWALGGQGGTEVMHAQNGLGIASNYMAWTGSPTDSTGTGSMLNVGFLWEETLANLLGTRAGLPDLRLNVFGLYARSSLDLPSGSQITWKKITQLKYGADLTYQALTWLGLTFRGDTVNYDTDHPGYIFSALTGRLSLSSHFLSGECIYLQYSRYIYGDRMVLAGKWPWNTPLVAGTDVIQGGIYNGQKPDANVLKLQAQIVF
jgi:hypothetical protein